MPTHGSLIHKINAHHRCRSSCSVINARSYFTWCGVSPLVCMIKWLQSLCFHMCLNGFFLLLTWFFFIILYPIESIRFLSYFFWFNVSRPLLCENSVRIHLLESGSNWTLVGVDVGYGVMNIILDAEMILSIACCCCCCCGCWCFLLLLVFFIFLMWFSVVVVACLFVCGFCVFVHYTCVCLSLEKRKLVYPQAWSRRWKRFIRRYQSSFHSMTIERGPIPTVPEGLSMSLPKIKYDLRWGQRRRERKWDGYRESERNGKEEITETNSHQ